MILVFDIGKTNKKCLVFDAHYRVVFEETTHLPEIADEDGDPCEDLALLSDWLLETCSKVLQDERFEIQAVNCTAYGASFVHLDAESRPLTPLYNYLKPFPENLHEQFFEKYGPEEKMALETASPVLGSLNSGLQLYRLKYERPEVFRKIKWSLHLPQYLAFLLESALKCGVGLNSSHTDTTLEPGATPASEITSIGCHTMLWDFQKNDYHEWVKAEGLEEKFPALLQPSDLPVPEMSPARTSQMTPRGIHHSSFIVHHSGIGLHDSSAALIPYLAGFREPFVLLSTGTWCISMNPFNREPLTVSELQQDCLCYLTFEGKPVKAARYFGGNEHENAVQQLAKQHDVSTDFHKNARLEPASPAETDYLQFMRQLVKKQAVSTRLAIGNTAVRQIFVDGGFSKNEIFMRLLAAEFPEMEVFAAEVAQATALGAALALHDCWNEQPVPQHLISLKQYGNP